jgi:hypothetical protein
MLGRARPSVVSPDSIFVSSPGGVKELGGEAAEPEQVGVGRYALCKDHQGVEFG